MSIPKEIWVTDNKTNGPFFGVNEPCAKEAKYIRKDPDTIILTRGELEAMKREPNDKGLMTMRGEVINELIDALLKGQEDE